MLTSDMESYPYVRTARFEAVALPCKSVYFLAVVPATGITLDDLVREFGEFPTRLRASMAPQLGRVDLPPFHITFQQPLDAPLRALGVRRVFESLGAIVNIPRSHLTTVIHRVDLHVDRSGVRADADTVGGAVYGGVMAAANAFHMRIDRPFLFMLRDSTSDALLFIGVVFDPIAD
jgi:serine protease inhibitor